MSTVTGKSRDCGRPLPVAIDDDRLRELWFSTMPIMDVAWSLGCYHSEVLERAGELGLPSRVGVPTAVCGETPDEEEIYRRAAIIRETRWSRAEHNRRWQYGSRRVEVRTVSLNHH